MLSMSSLYEQLLENFKKFGISEEMLSNPYFSAEGDFVSNTVNFSGEELSSVKVVDDKKQVVVETKSGTVVTFTLVDSKNIKISLKSPVEHKNENYDGKDFDIEDVYSTSSNIKYFPEHKTVLCDTISRRATRENKGSEDVKVFASASKYERLFNEDGIECREVNITNSRIFNMANQSEYFLQQLDMEAILYGGIMDTDLENIAIHGKTSTSLGESVCIDKINRTFADLCSHSLFYSVNGDVKEDFYHPVVPLAYDDHLHYLGYVCRERAASEERPVTEETISTDNLSKFIENATNIPAVLKPGLLKMLKGRDAEIASELEKRNSGGMKM